MFETMFETGVDEMSWDDTVRMSSCNMCVSLYDIMISAMQL